jgi:hypothetical protein
MVYTLRIVKMCLIFGSFPYQKKIYCYFLSNIECVFRSNSNIGQNFKTSKSEQLHNALKTTVAPQCDGDRTTFDVARG